MLPDAAHAHAWGQLRRFPLAAPFADYDTTVTVQTWIQVRQPVAWALGEQA